MSIHENISEFCGKQVHDFKQGVPLDLNYAYRLRVDWEDYDNGKLGIETFKAYVNSPGSEETESLVLGDWGGAGEGNDSGPMVEALINVKEHLPKLKNLFFGDIIMEESEISWIVQSDLSGLQEAYPMLEQLVVRGGTALSLGDISYPAMKKLIIQTGGLDVEVVRQILNGNLQNLKHLELWFGDENYGANTTIADLQPLLSGKLFPKLEYLGLRNSEFTDDIATALVDSPIIDRLKVLDLSMGTLGDKGGQALLQIPKLNKLEKLDLHFHYFSDEMMEQLKTAFPNADLSEQEEEDDWDGESHRYVAVSE